MNETVGGEGEGDRKGVDGLIIFGVNNCRLVYKRKSRWGGSNYVKLMWKILLNEGREKKKDGVVNFILHF